MFYAQRDREREREEGEKDTHCLENEVCGHGVVSPNQHYPDESHTRRLNREKKKRLHALYFEGNKKTVLGKRNEKG